MSDAKYADESVRCNVRCNANQVWRANQLRATRAQKYRQAAQDLSSLVYSGIVSDAITQVAVFVRVSRERGGVQSDRKGETNSKSSTAMFWLLLACVAVKHPPTALDRNEATCRIYSAVGPKQGPFYSNQRVGRHDLTREPRRTRH
jgi:hypothetical protein